MMISIANSPSLCHVERTLSFGNAGLGITERFPLPKSYSVGEI